MSQYDFMEFTLTDGSQVRLELASVGDSVGNDVGHDLPAGIGGFEPVGRTGARVASATSDALRTVLKPLGPVLQQIHDAVGAIADPPHELSVEFGVQVGQDLKIGIVGANGQASITVSASWQLTPPR